MKAFLCAVVCVAAIYCGSIPPAQAITYNYSLNGTLAEDNGIGPSLVAYGGSFAPGGGYIFGVQQGLSLSGTGIYDSYSIDIRFYLDDIYNGYSTYQKIVDFRNLTSDMGLYSLGGDLKCFTCGQNYGPAFSSGQLAALRITAADGVFSMYVNGVFKGSADLYQGNSSPIFSDGIIWLFMDDYTTLTDHPIPESGSGYIESLSITITPIPGALWLFATGLAGMGLLGWRRKKAAA